MTTWRMDPFMESLMDFNAHVAAWKWWYQSEGRHLDNGLRHPDQQLENPPVNAQNFKRQASHNLYYVKLQICSPAPPQPSSAPN